MAIRVGDMLGADELILRIYTAMVQKGRIDFGGDLGCPDGKGLWGGAGGDRGWRLAQGTGMQAERP